MSRGKKHNTRSFIQVPIPRKKDLEPIEIDLPRLKELGISVIGRIFQRVSMHQGARNETFVEVPGLGVDARQVDISPLREALEDIMLQWREALLAGGETGKKTWKEIKELGFQDLLEALAKGDIQASQEALQNLLYSLLSSTSTLAGDLERALQTSSGMFASVDRLGKSLEDGDEIQMAILEGWAEAAKQIITLVSRVRGREAEIRELRQMIAEKRKSSEALLCEVSKWRNFLEGDNRNQGFLILAFDYSQRPDSIQESTVRDALDQASSIVSSYRDTLARIENEWATEFDEWKTDLLGAESECRECARLMNMAMNAMRDIDKKLNKTTARPFDLDLITIEDFELAESYRRNPEWAPIACSQRLTRLAIATIELIDARPQLPSDLEDTMNRTAESIDMLNELLNIVPEPLQGDDVQMTADGKDAASGDRLEEVIEMVTAVGYITTGQKSHPFWRNTAEAMLDILQIMGHCTEDEVELYKARLRKHLENSKNSEELNGAKGTAELWKKSKKMWICMRVQLPIGPRLFYKLTKRYQPLGKELLEKHGLDAAQIERVKKERSDARQEQYRRNKEKYSR